MSKVLFIAPSLNGGGAERVMTIISNKLVENGHKVAIALTKTAQIDYEISDEIELNVNKGKSTSIGQIIFIRNIIKKYKCFTVVSFFTYQNIYSIIASAFTNNRIIVSERNDPSKTIRGNTMRVLRNFLYSRVDKIVFQTVDAQNYFPKKVRNKSVIIYNPVKENLSVCNNIVREKRFVAVSRLTEQKNLYMMIDAVTEVFQKFPEYRLDIYGVGSLEQDLKKRVKELGMDRKIEFHGFVQDVHEKIVNAAIYLSSSNYEGISNSLLEAMAMGLPCISTDCPIGGARMLITDRENGILVPVNDSVKMKEAIIELLEHPELCKRISQNAMEISKKYKTDNIVKMWESVIEGEV